MYKSILTIILIGISSLAFAQTGKVGLDITITDTVKPYFLDVYFYKEKKLIKRLTVTETYKYFVNGLEGGNYTIEFTTGSSNARRLKLEGIHIANDSTTALTVTFPVPCKFIYPVNYMPSCPYNHSDKIIPIVYGFPAKKTFKKAKNGLVRLGGCLLSGCDPKYYCKLHKLEL